jgi:sigma-B regulation protein RsbU (phosphoserine phosphatase)
MNGNILQQLKENLTQRKQNILEFLKYTATPTLKTRFGPASEEEVGAHIRQLDSVLKKAEDKTLGLCEVCHEQVEVSRLEMDYTACVCLEHLTSEERTRLENDLELSQKVQKALLPHELPIIHSLEIAAFSQPAHIVGGDYFDFLRFKDDSPAFVIADVMGKGMAASMLMANLQASLHIITPENIEPANVVARLNHLFCHNIRLTKFVTLFLARYNETTGVLTYCNAGHNPPLLRKHNGLIKYLRPTGAAIGLIEQSDFQQEEIRLEVDDYILLYTDGVVESANYNKELFGEERLEEFLDRSSHLSAPQMIASLRETVQRFTQIQSPADDTTIIAMKGLL